MNANTVNANPCPARPRPIYCTPVPPRMRMGERRLVLETPEMHASEAMQSYISREVARPCKQWIHEVLLSQREADRVLLRTPDFVLLPDVETFHRRRPPTDALVVWGEKRHQPAFITERRWRPKKPPSPSFHWLAVATDTGLRTLRDLRGAHVPMLTRLYQQACQRIKADAGVDPEQVMAYIHYPPSVYQLHVHFKYPVAHTASHDTFRIHPLASVINNLRIDSDYYKKSLLHLPVYLNTELYSALAEPEPAVAKPLQRFEPVQIQSGGFRLLLLDAPECSPTTSPGSRPSTPDPPAGTGTGSATPATSP
jgi:hypothetical protein